ALASYDAALTIFRRLGDRYWLARTLNNLGFADLTLGDADRARSVLLEALPLRRELGDRLGEAVTLRNLGRASAKLDQRVQALAFYRRALDLSLELSDRRGAATAEKLLGELESSHDAAAARGHLERALTRFEEIGNRVETAEVLELLSRLDLEGGDAAGALELAKRARELEMAVRNPLGAVRALVARARAERGVGDVASAAKSFREALGELETLQQRLGDPGQRALFLASQRDVYEGHVDLLMELHRRDPAAGHDLEALEASEQARSRALLALLEGVGAGLEHGVSPELRERLRATERRLTAKTQRQLEVFSGKASKEEQRAAEQELYAALGELDRVRAEIRLENPRAVLPSPPKTLDAAAIRELLDPDTVLLEFLLGEERSFLWWVTPSTVESYELPARSVLEAQALKARQEVGDLARARSGARSALEVLGATLFAPVVDRLEDQRLVIVADGALHLVPFAALSLPGAGGEPLVVRHEVVSLPSASALDSQRRERRPERRERSAAATTLAILADPIFNLDDERVERHAASPERGAFGDLVRLPETRREAEAIAALLPSGNRLVELGAAARKSRVVAGELREVRIVHLATHGFVDPKIAELSGLMLSRFDEQGMPLDGFLGLHDVTNLELSAELVVLSGCRTALGKEIRGEGPVGLARGFMYAGVPRVVASLWQVRDRATAELMT
ncbi:MAG: CHAT domain-containing protein, partial [Acidobacteria bacterium]|nr:CHAT domain-containing protein [Acidobacteriota bacterium]